VRTALRVSLIVAVIVAAAAAARVATPSERAPTFPNALACGVERWTVKTLGDRPRLLPVRTTTIAYLVTRPRPRRLPKARLPFERHIFRVKAGVTLVRAESDGDLHLVISDGARHMIAEAPSPSCTLRATRTRQRQMRQARTAVRRCGNAVITGVAFFDFMHGQTGVAPNAIELHPILGFRCLATPPPPPPAPQCSDGIDNDGDTLIDFPADPGCTDANDNDETNSPPPPGNCAPSYPTVCIPPPPPDLNCPDIPYRNFIVLWNVPDPDPHHFDGDHDGIGCET
jgi:hypothetical protein